MIETFTAELVVSHADQAYEPELARLAAGWFRGDVTCVALDVSMNSETGRPTARGTYLPQTPPSDSRLRTAAAWLGLVQPPGQSIPRAR